jgi:hypothetical protein
VHLAVALERYHVGLARLCLEALLIVVIEERVEPRAVDKHVGRVDGAHAPGPLALLWVGGVGARSSEVGVGKVRVDCERLGRVGVALEVGRLGLDQGEEDVPCIIELIVVQD